jgi:hypothetical protein
MIMSESTAITAVREGLKWEIIFQMKSVQKC